MSNQGWPGWPDLAKTYDTVAADYAKAFADELEQKPFDRELLDRFAGTLAGAGPVWDVGCGPAVHLARYLADRGVRVVGVDLSPGGIAHARTREPDLELRVADMLALPVAAGTLAGLVAFYSVIHLPRQRIPEAVAEFRRVLVDGGPLLIAMHGGEGEVGQDEWFGHPVEARATLVGLDELVGLLESAGFSIVERHGRPPYDHEFPSERLYVWARARPGGGMT